LADEYQWTPTSRHHHARRQQKRNHGIANERQSDEYPGVDNSDHHVGAAAIGLVASWGG
jgi:hypothetical protein